MIRNFLKSAIPPQQLLHAYIPDIHGKEKRKAAPGKEGKLGVEGMSPQVILDALRRCGATFEESDTSVKGGITKQDLFDLGLSGGKDSAQKRKELLKRLELPEHMSANAMLQALNIFYSLADLEEVVKAL